MNTYNLPSNNLCPAISHSIFCLDIKVLFVLWSHLLCHNWFACKQLISVKIASGLNKLISLRLKRISADKYKAWILMMRHAGELQKILLHHPFTWNKKKKQYIFKPGRSSRKHVSSYLSFSAHLVLYYFVATHARPSAEQDASGQGGFENAICSHTITSTLAARSCLFISAWRRTLMLTDFYEGLTDWRNLRLAISPFCTSPAEHHPDRCGCYVRETWQRRCK